jgi:interferon-induced GTP-binding protein Mx1
MAAGEHDEAAAAAPDQGITTTMSKRARPFLDLADALRQDGIQSHITIPQIAVMGDQSSGKSSVLQAISGIEFPRGSGLVTRCATQVTMSRGAEWEAELRVGGPEAGDGPVHKVAKNEQHKVKGFIEQLTTELCGEASAGGFCKDKWIEVKLVAPDMPDLTIIDLPGIVKTNTNGQTKEVIEQVDQLLKHYLEQPRTIILAVIKAPDDIATSDIVERATVVDPDGERTVGVLTMPDLVNPGAEDTVLGVLSNKTKPLKNGYFM